MQNGHLEQEIRPPIIKRCDGESLRAHWNWLRSKLEIVKAKALISQRRKGLDGSYATWMPEHIRMAVLRGLANQNTVELYFVMDEQGALDGFFIISCPFDEFLNIPLILTIWIAYSEKAGLLERVEPFVDNLALERGCVRIQHISGRDGHFRRQRSLGLEHGGWKLSQMVWVKEIVK